MVSALGAAPAGVWKPFHAGGRVCPSCLGGLGRTCIRQIDATERFVFRRGSVRSNRGYAPRYGIAVGAMTKKSGSLESGESKVGGVSDTKPYEDLLDLRGWRGGSVHDI